MTGHFDVFGRGIEPVRVFVPSPLPPAPPLDLSGAVSRLVDAGLLSRPLLGARGTRQKRPGKRRDAM